MLHVMVVVATYNSSKVVLYSYTCSFFLFHIQYSIRDYEILDVSFCF